MMMVEEGMLFAVSQTLVRNSGSYPLTPAKPLCFNCCNWDAWFSKSLLGDDDLLDGGINTVGDVRGQ